MFSLIKALCVMLVFLAWQLNSTTRAFAQSNIDFYWKVDPAGNMSLEATSTNNGYETGPAPAAQSFGRNIQGYSSNSKNVYISSAQSENKRFGQYGAQIFGRDIPPPPVPPVGSGYYQQISQLLPGYSLNPAIVNYNGDQEPGTIIISLEQRYLFVILENRSAMRFPVGVGREGYEWTGSSEVGAIREWPDWHPPQTMRNRRPDLPSKVPGGPGNPLGRFAVYIKDTEFRIHGTDQPETVGKRVSSGCIRLTNQHVEQLIKLTSVGSKIIVM